MVIALTLAVTALLGMTGAALAGQEDGWKDWLGQPPTCC